MSYNFSLCPKCQIALESSHLTCVSDINDSNLGTEFIMLFTENPPNSGDIVLELATPSIGPVMVSITTPLTNSPDVNEQVVLVKDSPVRVVLPSNLRVISSGIVDKAVLIQSTGGLISVGALNEGSCGRYLALPIASLGTEYIVLTWAAVGGETQMGIVSTEHNTIVEVTVGASGNIFYRNNIYAPGDTLTAVLHQYETLHIQATSDLSGTLITGSEPLVVMAGNADVAIGTGSTLDQIVSQLAPVSSWGTEFVFAEIPNVQTPYYLKVVAAYDSTSVTVVDTAFTNYPLVRGEFTTIQVRDNMPVYATSDYPVQFIQYMPSQVEQSEWSAPAALYVPSTQQYLEDYFITITHNPGSNFAHYMIIVVEAEHRNKIYLNSLPVGTNDWTSVVASNPPMSIKAIDIGERTYRIQSSQFGVKFGAYMYGSSVFDCAYAFPAGMGVADINVQVRLD